MLNKIKSTLMRWFGNGSAVPEPAKAKHKHAKPDNRKHDAADKNKSAKKKKERKEKPPVETHAAPPSPAPAPKAKPVKPAALKDIPAVEGKSRFSDFPIHDDVRYGIQSIDFEYATPIQAMTLPHALSGRDIAGKAQTGTGKTAAFLIAIFTHLLKTEPRAERRPGRPRALVLAPTRELAIQIHKDAEELGVFTGLSSVVLFGGMDHEKQRRSLGAMVDVVIGTPGRIIDYSRGSTLDLSQVEILVIDEADRMLDMGFIPDVKRIVAQLPRKGDRQTMLFSATLDESILRLASGWLSEPVTLESEPEKMVSENIEQTFFSVLREEKLALTLHFLRNETYDRMLIFGNRKDVNVRLQQDLERYGFNVPILSGDIPQEKRIKILERFRSGAEKVVIATDVAARGIHVDDVSLVLNYDLPERAEDYVHRIGRTGRAGNQGKSISFLCEYGAYNLPAIEELLGITFPSVQPTDEMVKLPPALYHIERERRPPREHDRRDGGRRHSGRPPRRR